jgi:iron complex outermembrane recepter protein
MGGRMKLRQSTGLAVVVYLLHLTCPLYAADTSDLAALSLEDLANLEVTSVSRKPESSFQAAAAIYVITQEDIHRSGAITIPQALRLAPGIHVAQISASQWSIGIRGFGSRLARSVLVLIDGRAVYNPLFAGTYWDAQDTLLDDIERIEVIRGPGGTLWGANAVNGVINIITKHAKDTHGGLIKAGAGSEKRSLGGARYGGKIGSKGHYRVFGKYADHDSSFHPNGNDFDAWHSGHSGFRTDTELSSMDTLTVQGDMHRGRIGQSTPADATSNLFEANVLTRWTRVFSETSNFSMQVYYDRTDRHDPTFIERRNTADIDLQHHFALGSHHDMTWGMGYRNSSDKTESSGVSLFDPTKKTIHTTSAFLQDKINLIPERLNITIGTKLENSTYSGWELQPSVRLQAMPARKQTAWASVSRAIRTPSRLERELRFGGLVNGSDFRSEEVIAYEVGYRVIPRSWFSTDIAAFHNEYDDLLSIELGTPFVFANGIKGYTRGVEWASDLQVMESLRLRGTYSLLEMNLRSDAPSTDRTTEINTEESSPQHQATLHTLVDLPYQVELDPTLRYVSALPALGTPEYAELDVRVAWHPVPRLELALIGQNLMHSHHPESGRISEPQRSVYGKVTWVW